MNQNAILIQQEFFEVPGRTFINQLVLDREMIEFSTRKFAECVAPQISDQIKKLKEWIIAVQLE